MPRQATRQTNRDGEVRYEVVEHLGVIGTYQTGWKKEVNIIEWNGNPSKLDIRDWSPDHQHLSRGVTLHRNEILELLRILLRNYGQELREIERRERRHESAEPRRNPIKTTGKPDTELEAGAQTNISSNEKSRNEAKQGTDFESEKGSEVETCSEEWSEMAPEAATEAASETVGETTGKAVTETGASSGSADSDAQEDAMIWAEDTGLTETAETLFA